jgi:predicted Zn-dependent peptidase
VLAATAEECDRVAHDGLEPGELARTVARMSTHALRDADTVLTRALQYAVHEQQRADPELSRELPARLAEVTEEQVRAAAATLAPARRATIEVLPRGGAA